MKPTYNRYLAAMALAVSSFAAPALHAQAVIATDGILLGLTGEVEGAKLNHIPSTVPGVTWLSTFGGLANRIVPVGQFTGFEDNGDPIPFLDLIPLRTSSLTLVKPDGSTVTIDGDNPGVPGPKGDQGPAYSEIIQLAYVLPSSAGQVIRELNQNIKFGNSVLALASPSNLYDIRTADTITLKPGHTYKLTFNAATASRYTGDNSWIMYRFHDDTAGVFFGSGTLLDTPNFVSTPITAFLTPTVNTTVSVKVSRAAGPGYQGLVIGYGYSVGMDPTLTVETVR